MRSRLLGLGRSMGMLVAIFAPALAGCGSATKGSGSTTSLDAGGSGSDASTSDSDSGSTGDDGGGLTLDGFTSPDAPPPTDVKVYAHDDKVLYKLDPKTLSISRVGAFTVASGSFSDQMTDIAIDKDGVMFGVSFTTLYRIDYTSKPGEARCAHIADLPAGLQFNGLTMIPAGMLAPTSEAMVGVTRSGDWYRIDVAGGATTATATRLGSYGGSYGNSGDAVGIIGDGVYAAMYELGVSGSVDIGVIDAKSGAVTKNLGKTGLFDDSLGNGIWGVGYWGGTMYGFGADGKVYSIDLKSAVATEIKVSGGPSSWWGAGVSTSAPTTIPR